MTECLYYVRNWFSHQHYSNRTAPWIKLEKSILHNARVQSLKIDDRWRLVTIWIIASDHDGTFTVSASQLRHIMGTATHNQALNVLARLEANGLISKQDIRGIKPLLDSKPERKQFTYSDKFLVFWSAYPRKVGKGDAAKSFDKAMVEDNLEAVLEAIEKCKKTSQWQDIKYIPHPATWLNQRRWEDEPDKPGFDWGSVE